MLGKKEKETLYSFRLLDLFHTAEVELIDFIIKNNRSPHYVDDLKHYRTFLRLKKKLRKSTESVHILTELFKITNNLQVSNKSTEGEVS